MTFGRRRVVAAVLPLLLVGACSDDPEPEFAPTPTPSPTSSSAAPTPEPWEEKSDAGAVAFAKHWIDVFNEAQATGDVTVLDEISADSCQNCTVIVEGILETYEGGGHVTGGELSIDRIKKLPPDYGADWGGFAKGDSAPQVITSGDGEKERYEGASFSLFAYAKWSGDAWTMAWLRTPS